MPDAVVSPPDSAWDMLLDLIDHLAATPEVQLSEDIERTFAALCVAAIADGAADRELHVADTARWLTGLVRAHRAVRMAHPDVLPDDDLAVLRVIITRWLHPRTT